MFKYRNHFQNDNQTLETLDFMQLKTCQATSEQRKFSYENVLTNASSVSHADYDLFQPANFNLDQVQTGAHQMLLNSNTMVQHSCEEQRQRGAW